MGRGDKKSRRGKIAMGSYGKTRPSSPGKSTPPPASKPDAKAEA